MEVLVGEGVEAWCPFPPGYMHLFLLDVHLYSLSCPFFFFCNLKMTVLLGKGIETRFLLLKIYF